MFEEVFFSQHDFIRKFELKMYFRVGSGPLHLMITFLLLGLGTLTLSSGTCKPMVKKYTKSSNISENLKIKSISYKKSF